MMTQQAIADRAHDVALELSQSKINKAQTERIMQAIQEMFDAWSMREAEALYTAFCKGFTEGAKQHERGFCED